MFHWSGKITDQCLEWMDARHHLHCTLIRIETNRQYVYIVYHNIIIISKKGITLIRAPPIVWSSQVPKTMSVSKNCIKLSDMP